MTSTYSDIAELTITEDEARRVHAILQEYPDDYLASNWLRGVERERAEAEDLRVLARLVLQSAYRWHEKLMLMSPFDGGQTKEMCLDIYSAVGIDPPADPGYIGHGQDVG